MPAAVADPKRSLESEQISPATIAHHTVYEKTPNLHQSHTCQCSSCCGPQAIARFGANLTSDDCTPHSVRKDTKPSSKPYMSMGSTAIPDGSAMVCRLVGKPPLSPWLSKNVLPLTKAGKDPNSVISLTAIFDRILLYDMIVTVCVLEYKKQKTGIGEQSCLPQP